MSHTKFDSNQTDTSDRDQVSLSVAKIKRHHQGPPHRGPMDMPSTTQPLEMLQIPHIYFSTFGSVVSDIKIVKENAGFGVYLSLVHLEGTDPNGELNLTISHCPDASYQIWFESA